MKWNVEHITGIGKRKENQDLVTIEKLNSSSHLFLIADGMGGYEKGKEAAKIASENILTFLLFSKSIDEKTIQQSVNKANLGLKIFNKEENIKSGATIGGAIIQNDSIHLFWVGDVKIYHITNGNIVFETESHNLINKLKEDNVNLSVEMIEKYKHVVTRSISGDPTKSIIGYTFNSVNENDKIIICSDGVHDIISKDRLTKMNAVEMDEVLKRDGRDNYSMIAICF